MTPPKLPKFNAITTARGKKLVEQVRRQMEENERREEQRLSLTGEYAPKPFPCVVCRGTAHPYVETPWNGRLGGPPQQAYVKHWDCSGCGIRYGKPPEADCKRRK